MSSVFLIRHHLENAFRLLGMSALGTVVMSMCFGLLWHPLGVAADPPTNQQLDHFENQIRPVLVQHCQRCHGAKKTEAGLRVDSLAALKTGGDSGAAVIPGDSEGSLLWQALNHDGFEMPPDEQLAAETVDAFRVWIDQGAAWPAGESVAPALGDQTYLSKKGTDHWAFQPIRCPEIPALGFENPLDNLIEAPLRTRGLTIAPRASNADLLRRISFDLTGLPVDRELIDREVTALSSLASEPQINQALIDTLLQSPAYAEHWGRHWLDVARYADTRDWYARGDLNYPHAWTYRDYVIRAFQQNLPFDDFIRQQLAADQLTSSAGAAERAALGFLTVGSRFRNRRDEQIADYIDLVSRGLQGLTVACARCHDHKYDPIPTSDYYALHGVFASSRIPGEFPKLEGGSLSPQLLQEYETVKKAAEAKFHEFLEQLKLAGQKDMRERWEAYMTAYAQSNGVPKTSFVNAAKQNALKSRAAGAMFDRMRAAAKQPAWKEHPFFGPFFDLSVASKQKFAAQRKRLARDKPDTVSPLILKVLADAQCKDSVAFAKACGQLFNQAMSDSADESLAGLREVLDDSSGPFGFDAAELVNHAEVVGAERGKFDRVKKPITDLEVNHPGAPGRAMVMLDGKAVDSPIQIRGNPGRRGDVVPRRFLSFVSLPGDASEALTAPFRKGSGRLELAEAIVSPQNPLTARVIVNWTWQFYFGKGFVPSNDFGLRTEQPEQVAALDYLAAGLIANGWDMRWLHQQILTSRTYQQVSQVDRRVMDADPDNRLFTRQQRRRLGYESMRDSMLKVSGRLDPALFGKPIADANQQGVGSLRRTLYQKVDRVDFDSDRATFDFPRPDASSVQRLETTVPQQLLFALNSPFVIDCAKSLTDDALFQALGTDQQKVVWLFDKVLGRQATADEVALFTSFQPAEGVSADSRLWQWGYGHSPLADDVATGQPLGFTALPHFTGQSYQVGAEFPDKQFGYVRLTATGGHPGNSLEHSPIVRWTSPLDAELRIQGVLKHPGKVGDGVRASTFLNGKSLGVWSAKQNSTPTPVKRFSVKKGDVIDFVVDSNVGGSNTDSYLWNQIISVIQPKTEKQSYPKGHTWNAREMFGAPPLPPLDRWQMAAQSLLICNEFFYVD